MKKQSYTNVKYTQEELELIEALEKGPIVRSKTEKQDRKDAQIAARNFAEEQKQVQILLSTMDKYRIEQISEKQGVPYQTFISNLVHEYVENHPQ